jgi:hypothetical protein
MVSDAYRQIEDGIVAQSIVHEEVVREIMRRLGKEQVIIEQTLSHACIALGARPLDMACAVNEFLICLDEIEHPTDKETVNG